MDDTKRAWVQSWLSKAQSDLRSARALVALSEPATDTAIYHCQHLERTHDLERLLELAAALDRAFAPLETQADVLNPYATAFRYPDTLGLQFKRFRP